MTPDEVNHYLAHLFHTTDILCRTTDYILQKVEMYNDGTFETRSPDEANLIHFFRHYTEFDEVFDKLLDFRSGEDKSFRFNRGQFG